MESPIFLCFKIDTIVCIRTKEKIIGVEQQPPSQFAFAFNEGGGYKTNGNIIK